MEGIRTLLNSCKLEAVAHKRENTLKTVSGSTKTHDALQMLANARVLSLPVVDKSNTQFVGVFSVTDVLRHLVKELNLEKGNHDMTEGEVVSTMRAIMHKPVTSVMHTGDLWYVEGQNPSVMDAMKDMLKKTSVHHRLFTCSNLKDTRPNGILSQSDIVQIVWDHKVELGDVLQQSVDSLGLCAAAAETVSADETTIKVLLDMWRDRKTCMGITNRAGGDLIGNVSVSDIRFLSGDQYHLLMAPVGEFVLAIRNLPAPQGAEPDWKLALQAVPVHAVRPDTTFERVLDLLITHHLHRVYVVDNKEHTVGVITFTDILRTLLPSMEYSPSEGPAGGLPSSTELPDEVEASEQPMVSQVTVA